MAGAVGVVAVSLAVSAIAVLTPSDYDRIVAAGQRTEESGSARVTMTTVADVGVGWPKQRVDITGLVDFAGGTAQLEVRTGSPQTGPVISAGTNAVVLLHDGRDTFVRYASWRGDRPWLRVEREDSGPGGTAGVAGALAVLSGGVTDVAVVDDRQPEGGDGSPEGDDREPVRDDGVTRYHVTVDVARAAQRGTPEARDFLVGLSDRGLEEFVLDVWTDGKHVRRLSYTVPLATAPDDDASGVPSPAPSTAPSAPLGDAIVDPLVGRGATLQVVVEYSDFGVPVSVTTPDDAVPYATRSPASPDPAASGDPS